MAMIRECIDDIQAHLRNEQYRTRDQVLLGVAARLLHELGWNIWDPAEIGVGYTPAEGHNTADFALFLTPGTPSAFVALCAPGTLKDSLDRIETALGELHAATPALIAAASDGELWKFYAPEDETAIAESCFRTLDLREEDAGSISAAFTSFLSKTEMANGNARRSSRRILVLKNFAAAAPDILPIARRMVSEPPFPRLPEAMIALAAERGFAITEEDAVKILTRQEPPKEPSPDNTPPKPEKETPPAPQPAPRPNRTQDYTRRNIRSFRFLDRVYTPATWKELLLTFCEAVYELRGDEFGTCLSIGINNRSVFSRNIKDLFGNAPMQIGRSEYYVMTNFTANHIVQLIYRITDLFGYSGDDIEITAD
jgi:hypothetical protein